MWLSSNNIVEEITNADIITASIVSNLSDINFNNNVFSTFYCNIRSLVLHIDELLVYLKTTSHIFDIIVLIESWLNDNLNICIDGYKYFHSLGTLNK